MPEHGTCLSDSITIRPLWPCPQLRDLALGGGTIAFGQGLIGGLMMIGSAVGMYVKTQQTFVGLVLAGPLALAGLIAIVGQFTGGKSGSIGG
jgi:hypothetical protein